MGKMFPFITETWNPVAGACPFDCSYCWAKTLILRRGMVKYQGAPHLDEKAMQKIPHKGFIFVQDMSDISTLSLPDADRLISELSGHEEATYLLLTKNPDWYVMLSQHGVEFPNNVVLGATIETNRAIGVSKAPHPTERFRALAWLNHNLMMRRLFISIEPIMDFDRNYMLTNISLLRPSDGVAIGYDNYYNNLPEPSLAKTTELIESLEKRRIRVYRKTLREANLGAAGVG